MLTSAASLSFPSYSPSHLPPFKIHHYQIKFSTNNPNFPMRERNDEERSLTVLLPLVSITERKLKGDRWCLIREV